MNSHGNLALQLNTGFIVLAVLMAGSGAVLYAQTRAAVVIVVVTVSCATLAGVYLFARRILAEVRRVSFEMTATSEQMASAAKQLSSASQALAQGVSTQAESLAETSGTSGLMASITRQNAESSRSSMSLINEADSLSSQVTGGLETMLRSIHESNASARKISHITKVVDEIAFQTNILALNAAVEAARSGEAGAGFAVVAGEVRNLAQRSAQAAQDIAGLVEESVARTQEGTAQLDQVSIAIRALITNTSQVRALVDEVATNSEELARGTDQISTTMKQLEDLTQRTAASSQETAATSQEMSAQAESVQYLVSGLRAL
jgi:methyl-accepting chemotaxis protein